MNGDLKKKKKFKKEFIFIFGLDEGAINHIMY